MDSAERVESGYVGFPWGPQHCLQDGQARSLVLQAENGHSHSGPIVWQSPTSPLGLWGGGKSNPGTFNPRPGSSGEKLREP